MKKRKKRKQRGKREEKERKKERKKSEKQKMGKSAGVHVCNPRLLEIVARRPTYVGLALWFLHHPALVEGHTGGSLFTPTVHPC